MSKILDVNELLELAIACELPSCEEQVSAMEAAATALTEALADHLGINHTGANFEPGFGGLCGVFQPKYKGQPMPPAMEDFDTGGDWEDFAEMEAIAQEFNNQLKSENEN
jgi:hypothetical protein